MEPIDELILPDAAAWRSWLDHHEDTTPEGVWLVLAKKGKPAPTAITRDEALEEALCSGWIDAMARGRDEVSMLQRYTPRRARSTWSARNVNLVGELIEQDRMRPRGQAEIDRAKADGRWQAAYEGSRTITVPDDLAAALTASPAAAAAFERLSSQNRYAILFRLHHLKTAEARVRNIAKYVTMLESGETIYPQRQAPSAD